MKIVKAQEFKNKPKNVTIITYMAKMKQIKIRDEFVTLGQFLKLADLISSGGEAKFFLRENTVVINDEEDDRRGDLPGGSVLPHQHGPYRLAAVKGALGGYRAAGRAVHQAVCRKIPPECQRAG